MVRKVDVCLTLVADRRRRRVLSHLRRDPENAMSLDELVDALLTEGGSDGAGSVERRELAVDLHHRHLPKLADEGALEYDPQTRTARYEPIPRLEAVLDGLPESAPQTNQ